MKFTHYILTRYNVGLYSDNPYNIENPDGWMLLRIFKFLDCLDSVKRQKGEFKWVVFIDKNTPYLYVEPLLAMSKEYRNLFQVTVIPPNMWIPNESEWILTTRLDNDDILEPDFVETVQAQFCEREGVIDVEGRQYDTATGKYYTVDRRYPNSPFITLVEKGANPKTVFHKTHTDLHKDYKWSAYVKGKPLYTQVIHGNNLANKITGKEV